MTYFIYNAAWTVATPFLHAVLALRPAYRPLRQRFAPPIPPLASRPIWIQAVSVGEVRAASAIIDAMKRRWPETATLLTTSTNTGYQLAHDLPLHCPATWFPFDRVKAIKRFIQSANPRALVLMETEIWPNTLRQANRHNIPIILINGRLSDKHHPRYRRFRSLLEPILKNITLACMQNEEYAQRIQELGLPAERIHVTGSTKFDGLEPLKRPKPSPQLQRENGFVDGQPMIIFASARPGDEAMAASVWRELKDEFPALRLTIAPRHLHLVPKVKAAFHEPMLLRSEVKEGRLPKGERIFILDTLGELRDFYALATVAVIGGSFSSQVQGHNPLESAAAAIPTLFGPHMRNFSGPARVLLEAKAARQVQRRDDLTAQLRHLLNSAEDRAAMVQAAFEAITRNQGAIQRNLDLIQSVVSDGLT